MMTALTCGDGVPAACRNDQNSTRFGLLVVLGLDHFDVLGLACRDDVVRVSLLLRDDVIRVGLSLQADDLSGFTFN